MPDSRVVVDASVAIRAVAQQQEDALEWLSRIAAGGVRAMWPQLAFAEIANGLATLVRTGWLAAAEGSEGLRRALALPIEPYSLELLAEPALAVALDRSVSASDACYIVLAEVGGATLLTADRKLAGATDNAVLLSA